ncbi:MAG: TetR family transcriptional regulator [Amycolatopsis sp.]|jgi:AcrR family transcriptional regulator|uniref:TetR/AcrR family transcriptional regulator n=1 Tax=Amycolatopsis sp. TaxID=37632 RepID=UPI002611D5B2|nr:TetR/AcrR family transcriptional regulator [Amycolatopsis sp.]MCU1682349.1 TetR family transcriptional regulator [Amycolatopsis sp.]
MPAHHQPVSRRERPAKPALTREGIVATAVRVMRSEGLERVTMRRLATELDTGPASLYVYVTNTVELHAAILEEMLGEVDLGPVAAAGDWRERIDAVLSSYRHVLYENPGLARSALVARPSGPNYLNLVEALLVLLGEGGVPDAQAAWGVDLLLQDTTANAAEHAGRDDSGSSTNEWNLLAAALADASSTSTPRIAALGAQLLSGPPLRRRKWAVRTLLDGMLHTPLPE